jgi:hypothetical protein
MSRRNWVRKWRFNWKWNWGQSKEVKETCLPADMSGIQQIKPRISIRYVTVMQTEPEDFGRKQNWYTCGQKHCINLHAEVNSAAVQLTQLITFHRSKRNWDPIIIQKKVLGVNCDMNFLGKKICGVGKHHICSLLRGGTKWWVPGRREDWI